MTLNFSSQTMEASRATSLRYLKKKQKQNKTVQLKFYCEQIFKILNNGKIKIFIGI